MVAGTGTAEAELKRQSKRLGLGRHGTFLGWVGDDMLHSLYRVADLCIVPSIYEPFGLVALEAMASGCLCIVADTGGLREVVPEDGTVGLRFPSRDSAALGEILEQVLTDDAERAQLVAEAREHVLRFDWAEVARRTREVYDSLPRPPAPAAGAGGHPPLSGRTPRARRDAEPSKNSAYGWLTSSPTCRAYRRRHPYRRRSPCPGPRRRSPRW